AAETATGAAEDLTRLDGPALLKRLEHCTQRTLLDFARDSLKPTALAGLAMGRVERLLMAHLGPERTRAAVGELVMGVHPDPEADLPGAMRDTATGALDRDTFQKRFGHRGPQEMELSQPRWAEMPPAAPDALARDAASLADASGSAVLERISSEAKLQ